MGLLPWRRIKIFFIFFLRPRKNRVEIFFPFEKGGEKANGGGGV
jgi:hypothetical protein